MEVVASTSLRNISRFWFCEAHRLLVELSQKWPEVRASSVQSQVQSRCEYVPLYSTHFVISFTFLFTFSTGLLRTLRWYWEWSRTTLSTCAGNDRKPSTCACGRLFKLQRGEPFFLCITPLPFFFSP
jgi:hypothetical protein